jgi:hypothetical protein
MYTRVQRENVRMHVERPPWPPQTGAARAVALEDRRLLAVDFMVFNNPNLITIPAVGTDGPANPYPSIISVSGMVGVVTDGGRHVGRR